MNPAGRGFQLSVAVWMVASLAWPASLAIAKPGKAKPAATSARKKKPSVKTVKSIRFSFESGSVQGWTVKPYSLTMGKPYNSQAYAFGGTHCLGIPLYLDRKKDNGELQGEAVVYFSKKPVDFTPMKQLDLRLKVTGGLWNKNWIWVQPYFFRFSAKTKKWDYISEAGHGFFPGDDWQTISWDVTHIKPRNKIGEFGLWISGGQDASGSATLFLDEAVFLTARDAEKFIPD